MRKKITELKPGDQAYFVLINGEVKTGYVRTVSLTYVSVDYDNAGVNVYIEDKFLSNHGRVSNKVSGISWANDTQFLADYIVAMKLGIKKTRLVLKTVQARLEVLTDNLSKDVPA